MEFEITNVRRVSYGKKMALFDVAIGAIGDKWAVTLHDCGVIASDDGAPKFIAAPAVKDFRGQYQANAAFGKEFKAVVFEAVLDELLGDRGRHKTEADTQPAPTSTRAEEQEARFERAFDELGGAA